MVKNAWHMEEEIDYRTLSEAELKAELKKLEHRILRITGDPIGPRYRKFFKWAGNETAVERVQEMMSTRSYILSLLFEKHCTPAEVARLEKVNALLLDLTNRTYARTANLARMALAIPREDLDDDITIKGKFIPDYCFHFLLFLLPLRCKGSVKKTGIIRLQRRSGQCQPVCSCRLLRNKEDQISGECRQRDILTAI